MYQSLEKEIPGSPVYQSLKPAQEKLSDTTGPGFKSISPEQSTLPNPKSSAIRPLNSTSKCPIVIPNPKVGGATGSARPNPYSTGPCQTPRNNDLHEEGADCVSTPDALYIDLERPNCGQDDDAMYLAPSIKPNYQIGFQNPCVEGDQVYTDLKGPEVQNCPENKPDTTQEPLYNILDDPEDEEYSHVGPNSSTYEQLYNVVVKPESAGSRMPGPNKPRHLTGCSNPAYEQTLDFDQPSATSHGLGIQKDSVYEPLRRGPTQEL